MDLAENWSRIKSVYAAAIRSSRHCAIASVGIDGKPHVTPVGFVFLNDDGCVYFFDEYTKNLSRNIDVNPNVCLLFVNSSAMFWGYFLLRGRFSAPPGVRLMGVAGNRRPATATEKAALHARIKRYRNLKGSRLIWNNLEYVRDVKIERFEPITYPDVTDGLWLGYTNPRKD